MFGPRATGLTGAKAKATCGRRRRSRQGLVVWFSIERKMPCQHNARVLFGATIHVIFRAIIVSKIDKDPDYRKTTDE